jgi:PAS domain S-box-containing protein
MTESFDEPGQSNRLLCDVATHMTATVSYCDRDFRYLWVTNATAEMLGSTKSDMEGSLIADVIGRPAFDHIQPHMKRALDGHTVRHHTHVQYARVGWRWIDATYVPTFNSDSRPAGWVATVADTTRLTELEMSLASLKTESSKASLATLQHELRNPLAAVNNALEALRVTATGSSKAQELTDLVQRQLRLMNRIVSDLTDNVQPATALEPLKRMPLQAILQTALDATRHLFELTKHDLRVLVPEAPVPVYADADRLSQALVNLLRNSAQYTPLGGVIQVTCGVTGSIVEVSVKDSGIGILSHELSKVFELYMRGKRPQELQPHGLGIGLKVVKQIVESHNGTIEVKSDGAGRGAEFIIRLPLAAEAL